MRRYAIDSLQHRLESLLFFAQFQHHRNGTFAVVNSHLSHSTPLKRIETANEEKSNK